jgi:hypothetical protein
MSEFEDWSVVLELLPSGWEQVGRSSGAVRRLRGFASMEALLHTLLLHVGCGWSLRETAVQAKLAGIADVSDVTLLNRLRDAEAWLRHLCQQLWQESGVSLQPALGGRAVRVLDATVVREPGPTGSQWRIHYSLRLPSLECDSFELTPTHGQGSAERFGHFVFQPGELVLADAGYCHPAGIAAVVEQQADVCVRLNPHALPLYDEQGEAFSLTTAAAGLRRAGQAVEWPVEIHSGAQRIAGRVCAIRKSHAAIDRAHRRLREKLKSGKSMSEQTWQLAQYVMVFTTLSPQVATTRQVLECYRLRWQVELTFKRLKSIAQLGHLPKYHHQSSRAWLYGKLLVALLAQKLARLGKSISPWGYPLPETTHAQPMA